MININEFNVLVEYERNLSDSAREFLHMNAEEYNNIVAVLNEKGLIQKGTITKKGISELEPYRVKRAVFMAAGFGSRMTPLTYVIPKPLVDVNGKRIIESILDAVLEAGIEEIYIVRGYMKEAFNMLLDSYPMIQFIDNPYYNEANNISSAYVVKDMLKQAYMIESDLLLYNKRIIRKYEYATNYLGRKTDYTDDWCFKTKDGIVTELLVGGSNVHHMYGISFWNTTDAQKMSRDIKAVYDGIDGHKKYWDEVSMRECKENYNIMVKPVYDGDIIEIDTYDELAAIDKRYCINRDIDD